MASKPADRACAKHSGRGISFGKMTEQIPLVNRGEGCAPAERAAANGAARICRRVMRESMSDRAAAGQHVLRAIHRGHISARGKRGDASRPAQTELQLSGVGLAQDSSRTGSICNAIRFTIAMNHSRSAFPAVLDDVVIVRGPHRRSTRSGCLHDGPQKFETPHRMTELNPPADAVADRRQQPTAGNRHHLYRFFAKNGRPRFPQKLCGPAKVSCSVRDAASNAA